MNKTENDIIKVYPNPANNIMLISGLSHSTKISIYDMFGNLILSDHHVENQIDVSNLSAGVYVIKIWYGEVVVTRKFIKQ